MRESPAMDVMGLLAVGSEKAPFTHKMVITLTGEDPGADIPSKMIAVYGGGVLELHGDPRQPWVRLGASASNPCRPLRCRLPPTT